MIFSDTDKEAIKDWLSGGTLYQYSYSTSIYCRVTYGNQNKAIPANTIDISDVRYKLFGLDVDMNYRIPTLQFTWLSMGEKTETTSSFPSLLNILKENKEVFRFYLISSLGYRTSDSDTWSTVALNRSCWFKIKDYKILWSTSVRLTGGKEIADVQITAIPRIYEYNAPLLWGPKSYEEGNVNSKPAYWMGAQGARNLARQYVDSRLTYELKKNSDGSITSKKKLTSPCNPEDAPYIYRQRYVNSAWSQDSEQWLPSYIEVEESGEYSFLTLLSKTGAFSGLAIIPEQYEQGFSAENDIDQPMVTFIDVVTLIDNESAWSSRYRYGDLGRFDFITIDDDSFEDKISTSYHVKGIHSIKNYEVNGSPVNTSTEIQFNSPVEVLGWVDQDSELNLPRDNAVIYDDLMIKSISKYNNKTYSSTNNFYDLQINKNGFRYWNDSGKSIFGFSLSGLGCKYTYDTLIYSDEHFDKVVEIDTKSRIYDTYSGTRQVRLYWVYTAFKRKLTFEAEWRPWLNIYDVIKVSYKDNEGVLYLEEGLLIGIDANADTLTANYQVLLKTKEPTLAPFVSPEGGGDVVIP